MNRIGAGLRAAAAVLAVAPLFAACSSMLDDETVGTKPLPSGGGAFATYAVIGTSISAGIQSGGINDSTQREGYAYQLALAMGLTPGVNWFYPSFQSFGCPAPLINPLAGTRVGGVSGTFCGTRAASSARDNMNNTGIPSLRAAQALDVTNLAFPATDTLKLAQFITGSISPITMVMRQNPTFVVVEVGANDVLGASTRGDTTLLTPAASFTSSITAIADSLDKISPVPAVAIMNVPNVTSIPHFTRASVLWCLKTGACPGVPATVPFSLASFTINNNCAPAAAVPGAVGDTYLTTFPALGAIVSTLAAGRLASLDCVADQALIATAAAPAPPSVSAGATINSVEYAAIAARVAAFNAAISTLATARGYALVDAAAALNAQAANIPPIPSFSTPTALFGALFSQDGVHPSKAGHRIIAQTFAAAINTKFGSNITVP